MPDHFSQQAAGQEGGCAFLVQQEFAACWLFGAGLMTSPPTGPQVPSWGLGWENVGRHGVSVSGSA